MHHFILASDGNVQLRFVTVGVSAEDVHGLAEAHLNLEALAVQAKDIQRLQS